MNVSGSAGNSTVSILKNTNSVEQAPTAAVHALNTSEMSRKEVQTVMNQGGKVSIGEEQLIRAIDRALKAMEGPFTTLEVSVHEKTHAIMVKVLNKETGEVIREVPQEKALDIAAKMMEIAGLLIDERV
ncbi:flagellar protein FlaG [Paenibacillus sp. MBLB2552]|uniref:Flagellar protein FlaG n=1 Tax=Paenibacillus mellifer TaxID=2937794 RepID=A0A9X2BR58_9BACL|nr:flagellar protein FlaG [Paenibacillus mellifer]MCK8489048.1 flagellar protein FlaG [Paenibacillus mellifer]